MPTLTQAEKALSLRELHHGPKILILPNAWDVASARIFEEAGFPAIGTTSAGIANSLGYPDGELIDRDEMIESVARIARAVEVPVTADMESGFGATTQEVNETAHLIIEAGAVGLNIEDSAGDPSLPLTEIAEQAGRIRAVQRAGETAGVPLVINARTDVYLLNVGEPESRFQRVVERAGAYREAGADCVFIPGVDDANTIEKIVRAVGCPVNILARAGVPSAVELQHLGVSRVSVGSGPMRAAFSIVRRVAEELLAAGTYASFTERAITYAEMNSLVDLAARRLKTQGTAR